MWGLTLSGTEVVAVDSPAGRLGLTVCYDLRFPELYQRLRFTENCEVGWFQSHLVFKCPLPTRSGGAFLQ
jgi:predicted amidohydrolase